MVRIFSLMVICMLMLVGPALASMASIGKKNVNVRNAPSPNAAVIFQTHLGYPVEVKQTKGSWVQIKDWDDNIGWVYYPLLNRNVQTVLVIPDLVNIRQGPGLKYRVVEQAEGGKIYKLLEEKGQWVKIGYYLENEEVGWVRSDMVWGE
jgi:SH3-like domain-containing protein